MYVRVLYIRFAIILRVPMSTGVAWNWNELHFSHCTASFRFDRWIQRYRKRANETVWIVRQDTSRKRLQRWRVSSGRTKPSGTEERRRRQHEIQKNRLSVYAACFRRGDASVMKKRTGKSQLPGPRRSGRAKLIKIPAGEPRVARKAPPLRRTRRLVTAAYLRGLTV